MLGQNVIIQSIGASSGVIVAGAIFTLPALYILGLDAKFYQIFLSSLLGGLLGILMLIPFRKYFVKDMHGKYPFPEATATTEVLVSGEKKGNQAKLLAVSGLVGGLYDFFISTFGWWTETISTRIMGWGEMLAEKTKLVFKVNTGAAVLGLGYIVGLKYAAIICAGSFTVWFVLIPFLSYFADGQTVAVGEGVSMLIPGHVARTVIYELCPSYRYRWYRYGRYRRHYPFVGYYQTSLRPGGKGIGGKEGK